MRILAFDHFFGQDLDALAAALGADDTLVRVPYQRLHRLARRVFPRAALSGLTPAYEVEAASWARYSTLARRRVDWWMAAYRPNVFVTPSDVFFYLRPVIESFRQLGIPTVVVQKETTISPLVMDVHSSEVGRVVPFMSDVMTVCSDRQRDFWVRAGADRDRIIVTGQPRFDVYARTPRSPTAAGERPRLLYLSYDDHAYLPSDIGHAYEGSWRELRRATEQSIARAGHRWHVVVKHHPQQPDAEEWLGPNVERAPQDADTRMLILDAAAVVGFQTTALFEGAVAGRPLIYAAWGEEYERSRSLLTPFETFDMVNHATSAEALERWLESDVSTLRPPGARGRDIAVEHLGRVDGRAAERVVDILRAHASEPGRTGAGVASMDAARAAVLGVGAVVLRSAIRAPGVSGHHVADQLARRATDWTQEWSELRSIIRRRPPV